MKRSLWERSGRYLLPVYFCGVLLYLLLPLLLVIPMSISETRYLKFPPQGFTLRWYGEFFASASWIDATLRSLLIAAASAVVGPAGVAPGTSRYRPAVASHPEEAGTGVALDGVGPPGAALSVGDALRLRSQAASTSRPPTRISAPCGICSATLRCGTPRSMSANIPTRTSRSTRASSGSAAPS